MATLVTMGAQHQGIMNVPGCRTLPVNSSHGMCHLMQQVLGEGAYLPFVRDHIVQAQYFKASHRLFVHPPYTGGRRPAACPHRASSPHTPARAARSPRMRHASPPCMRQP